MKSVLPTQRVQAASVASARKLATVTFHVLKEKRGYIEYYEEDKKGRSPSVRSSRDNPSSGQE